MFGNNTTTSSEEDKNKIVHDEVAQKLKKLTLSSSQYYEAYLNLCKAKEDYITAEQNVQLMQQLMISAKAEYDALITKIGM